MRRIVAGILAASLALPSSCLAQIARVPVVRAPITGAAGVAGMAGAGAKTGLPQSNALPAAFGLPSSDFYWPTVLAPLGTPAAQARPAAAASFQKAKAAPIRAAADAAPSGSAANGYVSASPASPKKGVRAGLTRLIERGPLGRASLSRLFDGFRAKRAPADIAAPTHYGPELTDAGRLSDRRYAALIEAAPRTIFRDRTVPAPKPGRRHKRGARKPALLERMRKTDANVYSHMARVGLLAGLVALKMGLGLDLARRVTWTATLHDVGKMEQEILAVISKRGKLNEEERRVMERHTVRGAEMLLEAEDLDPEIQADAVLVALNHHERMDGTGYPRALPGSQIPIQARITSVADFLDALMENRPYQDGRSLEKAMEIIEGEASRLDPLALKALHGIISDMIRPEAAPAAGAR
ncbi:MAG: HD domain-containing phosphohydrolase [Elusimicrobiota bacterium]